MKPPKIIRPTKLTLALPEDIRAKLDLHLFSEVERRVPMGAYQRFFVERIQDFFGQRIQRSDHLIIAQALVFMLQHSQEWWVENFHNPGEAYNRAHELLKVLSK